MSLKNGRIQVMIWIDKDQKVKLEELARKTDRTLTALCRQLFDAAIKVWVETEQKGSSNDN